MFDIGFWELMLVVIIALLVLGPAKVSQLAFKIGKFVSKAREYMGLLQREMAAIAETQSEENQPKEAEDGSG